MPTETPGQEFCLKQSFASPFLLNYISILNYLICLTCTYMYMYLHVHVPIFIMSGQRSGICLSVSDKLQHQIQSDICSIRQINHGGCLVHVQCTWTTTDTFLSWIYEHVLCVCINQLLHLAFCILGLGQNQRTWPHISGQHSEDFPWTNVLSKIHRHHKLNV